VLRAYKYKKKIMKKVYQTAQVEIKKMDIMPLMADTSTNPACMNDTCVQEGFGKDDIWED